MCWLCREADGFRAEANPPPGALGDAPQGGAARIDLRSSGLAAADGLLSGFAWDAAHPVSFSFPDSAADYEAGYGMGEPLMGFARIGAGMRDAVRQMLSGEGLTGAGARGPVIPVTGFTHLSLFEEGLDWAADLRIARSAAPSTAWAYYPSWREGGDVWFGTRTDFNDPRPGSYQWVVAVHELGHALGLKHPHEAWNGFGALATEWDSLEYSVMSYRSRTGAPTGLGYTNGTHDYPQGWMMLDIAALQHLYGADYSWRSGHTTYAWDPLTGEMRVDGQGQGAPGGNRVLLTIWDGGGVDTYDLSNYATGVLVDLAPGGHSVLSTAQLALLDARLGSFASARGNVFNALLHGGDTASLIENATGGAGADTLSGNAGVNVLRGNGGADLLSGGGGADVLEGGAGADTLRGGTGDDLYLVDAADRVEEAAGAGLDEVAATSGLTQILPAGVEMLVLSGSARHGTGNALANLLRGNALDNRLEGGAGNDLLEGAGGADTLAGGAGQDGFLLRRGAGMDLVEDFAPGQDRILLTGFGLTAAEVLARVQPLQAGLRLDLGSGDGLLLPGLSALAEADLVLG